MKKLIVLISLVLLPCILSAHYSASATVTNPPFSDWAVLIEGEWTPVDMAKGTLTFKYGILVYNGPSEIGGIAVTRELPYSVKRDHLILENRYPAIYGLKSKLDCPIKIYKEDGETYREIHSIIGLAGKYQKVR